MKYSLCLILLIQNIALANMLDGFWLDLDDFDRDYRSKTYFDSTKARDYIGIHNRSALDDADEIIDNIVLASDCLNVDPVYLLAKIHTESTFYVDARSSTGAAGLSQMTGIAIQEVKDQLGIRGNSYARASVIKNLKSNLKTCLGDNEFNELYALYKNNTNFQIKAIYQKDIKQSVIAGAIILKVFLAKNYSDSRSLRENYRVALEDYNGESTKAQYAQNIIDRGIKIRALFNQ